MESIKTLPASRIRFDTEFSSELNIGEVTDVLQQAIDNPLLFIRPEPTTQSTEQN